MIGIISYGFYIPRYRIKIEEIAKVWGKEPEDIKRSLGITEKAIASSDEDSLTMAYDSSSMALANFDTEKRQRIGTVFFGSETPAYAVNPTSTILGEFLGIGNDYLAYDTQFACKAATGAMITAFGLIKADYVSYALVCASDKASAKPHDSLEYTASSGSVSLILGKEDVCLELVDYQSFSSDTPDFWRREGIRYPSHGGRFTGKPSYFFHIQHASRKLFKKTGLSPEKFKYGVFHMPNGRFPLEVGISLGFQKSQIEKSLTVAYLGNSYTASALMGLASVLEEAKAGDLIFLASYGSGAGSDAFVFKVGKNINKRRKEFNHAVQEKEYIDYSKYLKFMKII